MSLALQGHPVLVTGAGGFIGGHLVEQLVTLGAQVRAFVRYTSRSERHVLAHLPEGIRREVELIRGDLRDEEAVGAAVRGCEVVFHLGAIVSIPYSYAHPREVLETNVLGTLNVLQALRDQSGTRLVHTSTSEVYGSAVYWPMDESHPLQAQSPYAASKTAADKLVESYVCAYDLDAVTVRPFNAFGPRQSGRAIIPTIAAQGLAGVPLRLGSLAPRRDFTFVSDTADGYIAAAEAPTATGRVINLGSGRAISIGELATRIGELIGRELTVQEDPARLRPVGSEVMHLQADNRLALDLLGWRPRVSLEDGLARTIAWLKDNPHWVSPSDYQI